MTPLWIQLWVERQAMDPAAWTAGHTLQLLLGGDAPAKVGRADLWELAVDGGSDDVTQRFDVWIRSSNLFLNPNRDRGVVLEGVDPLPGPACASVVTVDRGGAESRAHALTLGHALGGKWRVRRGTVWTLVWPPERAADVEKLAERAAWARRRSSGLLVNAESQDAVVLVGRWTCPALPEGAAVANGAKAAAQAEPQPDGDPGPGGESG
jgi:hypothetical protein